MSDMTDAKTAGEGQQISREAACELVQKVMSLLIDPTTAEQARQYLTEAYIQHNPNVPTGRDAAVKLFAEQLKIPVVPIADRLKMKITAVVAEGDYVAVILPRPVADPVNPSRKFTTTWIDMWRIRDGKADEHWDPSLRNERF